LRIPSGSLERANNFRSAQEIGSQTLQCCSAFLILNRKPDFGLHLLESHLASRLEIGQLNNVKTEAGANRLTDFSDAHFDDRGKKSRGIRDSEKNPRSPPRVFVASSSDPAAASSPNFSPCLIRSARTSITFSFDSTTSGGVSGGAARKR